MQMDGVTDVPDCPYSFNLINNVPLHNGDIVSAVKKDNVLIKVVDITISGWLNAIHDQQIKPYFKKRHELTVEQNCLLLGNKVVVPEALRNSILELFHEQHLGIVRTKINSPSTVTGLSPAEGILKNRSRTRFDLLKPDIYQTCKRTGVSTNSSKLYNVNELVYVKNAQTRLWNNGKIVKVCSYLVLIENEVKFAHAGSIRPHYTDVTNAGYSDSVNVTPVTMPTIKSTSSSNLNNKEDKGDKVVQDNINSPTKNLTIRYKHKHCN
ncbi:hypothetical protein ILUMI_22051 [Ignelater luminosus]|uniref:Uncharacterized protein n=1 Tax=Ignelater luminosus TaxID=2038154 RepID=A0A8K0G2Z5_IGNLU|nr:hypothetical protein ILUMI_22051 [Ignelater luminosus]